jgi:hypothetical protein
VIPPGLTHPEFVGLWASRKLAARERAAATIDLFGRE